MSPTTYERDAYDEKKRGENYVPLGDLPPDRRQNSSSILWILIAVVIILLGIIGYMAWLIWTA